MSEENPNPESDAQNLLPEDKSTTIDMTAQLNEVKERMEQMQNMTSQQIQSLAAAMAPQPVAEEDDDDDLMYTNPKAYKEKLAKEIESRMEQKMQQSQQSQAQMNSTMAKLTTEYPELNDPNSDFYKAVDKEYKNIDQSLMNTAAGIRLAVREAAASLALPPKAKRKQKDETVEDFSMSSKNSNSKKKRVTDGEPEISDITKAWSQLLGRDVDSEDYKKSINEISKRKDWRKFK